MTILRNQVLKFLIIFSLLFLALLMILKQLGLRINVSNSIPFGLYWMINKPIEKGDYVIFCPTNTTSIQTASHYGIIHKGFCLDGTESLMKQVAGMQGDSVTINANGVFINRNPLPFSKPILVDGLNQPLPLAKMSNYLLKAHELVLMTNQNPYSFDARYFGLTDISAIESVIKPILTRTYHQK